MINKAFCEIMMEGDAEERVFTFPIPTYNITEDFDWNSPNYDKIWEMTAKYGIPGFANYINSDMDPEDARSMCCRLRLDNRELRKRGGGLFGSNPLTGPHASFNEARTVTCAKVVSRGAVTTAWAASMRRAQLRARKGRLCANIYVFDPLQ